MILYHFTDLWNLENAGPEAILYAGLKAGDAAKHYPMLQGHLPPCVWFTSERQPTILFERKSEVCITVEISEHSKCLVSWPKWLGKRINTQTGETLLTIFEQVLGRDLELKERGFWKRWYVYFGDVPLKMIRNVDYADPQGTDSPLDCLQSR